MQQCPNCGHPNRAGVVFCENCGASLIGKMPLDTKSLNAATSGDQPENDVDSSVLTDVKVQGSSVFKPGDLLRLNIEGSPDPIIFEPKAESIFGRRDPATGAMPDVDLTPFAGYRMGVSRRHAAIQNSDDENLEVWDLGSSNGTFLNGQRLSAHRPYRLHNGDELRLGQMLIRVIFEPNNSPDAKPSGGVDTPSMMEQPEKSTDKSSETDQPKNAKDTSADAVDKSTPDDKPNAPDSKQAAGSALPDAPKTFPVSEDHQRQLSQLEDEAAAKQAEASKASEASKADKPKAAAKEKPAAPKPTEQKAATAKPDEQKSPPPKQKPDAKPSAADKQDTAKPVQPSVTASGDEQKPPPKAEKPPTPPKPTSDSASDKKRD